MEIIYTNKLDKKQMKEVEELQEKCNSIENLKNKAFLSNEINFSKILYCFYLYYEDSKLVSFLTTFMPQNTEAEIIGFTHPDYRRKGYFKVLLEKSMEELKRSEILNLVFVIEPNSKTGTKALKKYPTAKWERTEYTLSNSDIGSIPENINLSLEIVNLDNKMDCLQLTNDIFNLDISENEKFIQNSIDASDREVYIATLKEIPIGTFNINYKDEEVFIYGLGIKPEYQGKGYGRELLGLALSKSFSKGKKAILDVDSNNMPAYNLYTHNGFKIDYQADYYNYKI